VVFLQVESNWAIFVECKTVKWSFGNPDDEFLAFVVNFLTALAQIGEELFGQHGIAQINFDVKKHAGFRPSEVFVVSLENKFFLIMSDPSTTMKLDEETRDYFESIWQNIILDISDKYREDINKIVGKSASNFSMLYFEDLLFLHYYLRKQPELTRPMSPKGWGLVSHMSGGEIPLDFHVEKDPVVLAGYLAIIISFLMTLFDSKPRSLVFGTNNIQSLSFSHGEEYFLTIDAPFIELALDPEFYDSFFEMSDSVLKDLEASLKKRITEEILISQTQELEKMDIKPLLENYVLQSKTIQIPKKDGIQRRNFIARIFGRL